MSLVSHACHRDKIHDLFELQFPTFKMKIAKPTLEGKGAAVTTHIVNICKHKEVRCEVCSMMPGIHTNNCEY